MWSRGKKYARIIKKICNGIETHSLSLPVCVNKMPYASETKYKKKQPYVHHLHSCVTQRHRSEPRHKNKNVCKYILSYYGKREKEKKKSINSTDFV